MKKDLAMYPKYRDAYVRAFDKMLKEMEKAGLGNKTYWTSGEDVMRWWVGDDPNQITLEDYMGELI